MFPFTTLITQTFKVLKETLGLDDNEIVQIHSKAGNHSKKEQNEDGAYGIQKENYIDNLFVNYPFCLLSHIRFFDVLKTNQKEINYLLHRVANSVIVIDELQSYTPSEWDKIKYFIAYYAEYFNIRFILMSATLPKIHSIAIGNNIEFQPLIKDAQENYLQNANFSKRVEFDFSLLQNGKINNRELANILFEKSKEYSQFNNSVHTIIEFIYKKSATEFFKEVESRGFFNEIFVLSGTILEPRRQYIINYLKDGNNRNKNILLITTQVVEAGVDIDMDLGFKNISLLDSDEQLGGRINRNVKKNICKLYLFYKDEPFRVYKEDLRYDFSKKIYKDKEKRKQILQEKDFKELYKLVIEEINNNNSKVFTEGFKNYKNLLKNLNFQKINDDFKLIKEDTISIFVPVDIPIHWEKYKEKEHANFSFNELSFLKKTTCLNLDERQVSGKKVWELYISLVRNKNRSYIARTIDLKIISGIMSKFIFSVYNNDGLVTNLKSYFLYDEELQDFKIYGFYCFRVTDYGSIYDMNFGLIENKLSDSFILN